MPPRNRHFTGRDLLLDQLVEALRVGSTTSVLPQALRGIGGVGKTQLVVEFVYRHQHEYDLVWWIPAEQTTTVLTSLKQLAEALNLPVTDNLQETARTVLVELAGGDIDWLLVYDNADDPAALEQLVPSTGGHVIITTRNQAWSSVGPSLEVDVFERAESKAMLAKRTGERGDARINDDEAEELAERLGDLPLALEQAAAWYLATAMPISEYIELLDSHIKELLDEGKPPGYPLSIAAFVALALETFRGPAEATAQLFTLFAYLGGEPVPLSLLRGGSSGGITEPLRSVLHSSIELNRAVRSLSRYGLAKVDPTQRVQVHRLVQRVLRDTLTPEQQVETLRSVRNLLAAASPGDPDENGGFERQQEIGPHIEPADMVHAEAPQARQVVLDHARYLYLSGDYENCRYLATLASDAWAHTGGDDRMGPEGEYTLLARAQVANAMRTLGFSAQAAVITQATYEQFRRNPHLGPGHEFTLITGNQVGQDLRIAGRYADAQAFDTENVARHLEVFDAAETYTLRAKANLAVDYRMTGRYADALTLDLEIAERWEDAGGIEPSLVFAYMNQARSYYCMGAYKRAAKLINQWLPKLHDLTKAGHSQRLLAGRTNGITLRKLGRVGEAVVVLAENRDQVQDRFRGANHEFTVAAIVSLASALREAGQLVESADLLSDALKRYRSDFGDEHPLTLTAQVNQAATARARGEDDLARELDQRSYDTMTTVLGADHPYTICAGTGLATDLARAGELHAARLLSESMYERGAASYRTGHQARDGEEHPYLLMRAINLSYDLRADDEDERAEELYQDALAGLTRLLGPDHPEVRTAAEHKRLESDIEPQPT